MAELLTRQRRVLYAVVIFICLAVALFVTRYLTLQQQSLGDPASIFRCPPPSATSEIIVFVPDKDRQGKPIDQNLWVDEVLKTMGRLFGGATSLPKGKGVWRDDKRRGELVQEETVMVVSYAAKETLTPAAWTELYRTLSRMGREANQGEVAVVIDGKYYGITEYARE